MSRANSGRYVALPDGRTGMVYNKDCVTPINGKVPVYTSQTTAQADLFEGRPTLKDVQGAKILCDPKTLKVIGFFD